MMTLASCKLDTLTNLIPAVCGLTHSSNRFAHTDIGNRVYCSSHSQDVLWLSLWDD